MVARAKAFLHSFEVYLLTDHYEFCGAGFGQTARRVASKEKDEVIWLDAANVSPISPILFKLS